MTNRFVRSIGGYLPYLRLDRKSASAAMASTGLAMPRRGLRAVANWDEDPLTMATEAARGAIGGAVPDAVVFASTSSYFHDRPQSAIMVDALHLPREIATEDVGGSRRCAIAALRRTLQGDADTLIASAEKRLTAPGSAEQLAYGDGAAACMVSGQGGARMIGRASLSHDFIDSYTSRDRPTPYAYEARFIKETSVRKVLAPTIIRALADASIAPKDVKFAVIHEPAGGVFAGVARAVGIESDNIAGELAEKAGDLGAAHTLFALGIAFARAQTGDIIVAAGFGGGCDAIVFRVEDEVAGAAKLDAALSEGRILDDFVRFLRLTNSLDMDWGMRAEVTQKSQASVLERYGRDITGFIGGQDKTGNVQFPKSPIPVNPDCSAPSAMEDIRLADEIGTVVSYTADRLIYCPDPPFAFGLVQFSNGARVMMEFADQPVGGISIGDRVHMRFRIKAEDRARGFRTYFWKAAPVDRPRLET
ncbi:3-oxoacyl-[acyl-carrier-protein] synthase III C-terminal domain-containing protein [Hyphococcus sp.]|uniref:3-oxoacyl-[acyl-carrier-protein] synthase III C-terminal domain-containing protein n=1 Tax=Hyphococcus sp. TaxID=2038636 RepID=UPI0035C6A422